VTPTTGSPCLPWVQGYARFAFGNRQGFPLHLPGGAARGIICLALLPEKDPEDQSARFGLGEGGLGQYR
jgi:hypothetical protein